MRIVSFLPSATEVLYALGAEKEIVGVTHECKYPSSARKKPQVIRPSFDPNAMTGVEIDRKVVELMRSGGDIYVINEAVLKRSKPDLIVAQGLCEVCSPFTKEIARAAQILEKPPDTLVLDPHDLDDILVSIMDIAGKVDRVKEGKRLVASLQKRIDAVRAIEKQLRPRVACIEWVNPLFTAGHWVPQMVEYAGGINGMSMAGEKSRRMDIRELAAFDPDVIVMMPCGYDIRRTKKEMETLETNKKWGSLRAVKNGQVYAVEAGSYFSKPGPRTVTGLEILAKIIHPETSKKIKVPEGTFKKIY